ncbi:MAG: chromosome partitioning protein ParB, partial [Solirubrobacterales bacterium]|nr:chromosome partitioning protein ParB [Solirubrobacterales bacterium]
MRRGEAMPPIDLYKVGEAYFVRDGHHRVSVARALGENDINARVTEVVTRVPAGAGLLRADLPLKSHERVFRERVPLSAEARGRVRPSDPWDFARLAEGVEAWAFRYMQEHGELLDRREAARRWYEEEYVPAVALLRDAGMLPDGDCGETDAYLRVGAERYRLLRTHEWSEEVLERLNAAPGRRRRSDRP